MVKISILMPVYNAEEFLNKSIESVIAQTFSEWELICVDDESSDESLRILEEYSKLDDRIKIFTQKNTGPLGARRLGFEHSKGEYIIYLDADDYFSPDLLMSLYNKAIESNADAIAPDMIGGEQSWNKKNNVDINEELSGMQEETYISGIHISSLS